MRPTWYRIGENAQYCKSVTNVYDPYTIPAAGEKITHFHLFQ